MLIFEICYLGNLHLVRAIYDFDYSGDLNRNGRVFFFLRNKI
jgi:hypothetical protein